MKSSFPLTGHAHFAQVFHGQCKEASHPFFFEKLLERFWGRNQSWVHYGRAEFLFCASKIERDVEYISAALLPPSGLVFIRNKTVHANAQIGSRPAFLGIKLFEQFAFQKFHEESLREILRHVGGPVPSPAHVLIHGFPVRRAQRFQGAPPFLGINAARRLDYRPARRWEAIATMLEIFFAHVTGLIRLD